MRPRPRLDYARIAREAPSLGEQLRRRGLRDGPDRVAALLQAREAELQSLKLLEEAQARRNAAADKVTGALKEEIVARKAELDARQMKLNALAVGFPNWTHPDTPVGPEPNARVVTASKPASSASPDSFAAKDHLSLLGPEADFEAGARTSGSRFVFLKGKAALLELALCQLAMRRLLEHQFTPVATPDLIKPWLLEACGFQPRGESSQTYHVADRDLCLTGTAEIPLAGMLSGQNVASAKRFVGIGHCFRTEAGSPGSSQKGLYRVHQFTKVEMFSVTGASQSDTEHEKLVGFQTSLCDALGLSYRVLDMPTEELGASAYRKYDVEVWMPGSKRWGEVASVTNCQDFQARRLDIKMGKEFAHTLNGTALAVPRIILALVETHQDSRGVVLLPDVVAQVAGFTHMGQEARA